MTGKGHDGGYFRDISVKIGSKNVSKSFDDVIICAIKKLDSLYNWPAGLKVRFAYTKYQPRS